MAALAAPAASTSRDITTLGLTAGTATSSLSFGGQDATNVTFKKADTKKHENFRTQNVRYLQEQNKEATRELEQAEEERDDFNSQLAKWDQKRLKIEAEKKSLEKQLAQTEEKCNIAAAEVHKLNEQIRLCMEQNQGLMHSLEQEEGSNRQKDDNIKELSQEQDKLQKISDQYDRVKEIGDQQLRAALDEMAKCEEELRNAINETDQLREAELNFRQQAKIDLEHLEAKLKDSKDKNVEYLQQIQHNEVHEHRLGEGLQRLRETLEELTVQKKGIKRQMEMDVENRDKWTQSKTEVERRKAALENTLDALRQSLRDAEEQNAKMQEENKTQADSFRQQSNKVYNLMEQLRQHQVDLRKQEQAGSDKQKKIGMLDKQSHSLQGNLEVEMEAKLNAESEARNAAQIQALLQKKNKMLEDAHKMALNAQEKVEKRLQELVEKVNALQTRNDIAENQIEGNEEDKGALRYELRRGEEELRQITAVNAQLIQQRSDAEDRFNIIEAEKASLKAELDYVRREDMLDESGRTKPILIESESKLIERLQVNEFLFSAQGQRNPVPMLIEKLSHFLEMLYTAQTQADHYLQDLQKSNSMLTALRSKNKDLYEKVGLCETWKMRALLKIASNAFESREHVKGHNRARENKEHALYLDGLQYGTKELEELKKVITSYGKEEGVKEIRLQDNQLDKSALTVIVDLMNLCPYLSRLDLQRNRFEEADVSFIQASLERLPGVTTVAKDPATGDFLAKAGNQVRLVVAMEDQSPPDPNALGPGKSDSFEALFGDDPSGAIADGFLASGAGVTAQTRLQGPDSAAPGGAAGRTLMPNQKGGTVPGGEKLPKIPSAAQLGASGKVRR